MKIPDIKKMPRQALQAILYIRQAPDFVKDHKLWKGYFSHGWMATFTLLIALLFSYKFFKEIKDLISRSTQTVSPSQNVMSMIDGLGEVGQNLLYTGNMKFLMLFVLEMVVFHFAVKTNEVLTGVKRKLTTKDFIDAQFRMFKVLIRAFIYEKMLLFVVMLIFGIFGLEPIELIVIFLIQCYFIGVAFIDNYNEQFDISIKDSFKICYRHMGAVVLFGITSYGLMYIPIIGIVLSPLCIAVASTCYMYYSEKGLSPEVILERAES